MKTVTKLLLLTLAISVVGCNEKVSPELQSSNATTPAADPTTPPTEYYFSVTNSSDEILGYRLHKTGASNASTPCEVRSTTELSNDLYRGNPAANDITCYLDAEELALGHNGFKIKLNASKNTCQYVSHRPYGYYTRIPGNSSARYTKFVCGSATTTTAHIQANVGTADDNASGTIGCNQYLVETAKNPAITRLPFTITSDDDLCRFKYRDATPMNCDEGVIDVDEITVTHTPDTPSPPAPAGPGTVSVSTTSRRIQCGGSRVNCVSGAIRDHTEADESADMIFHNPTTAGSDFEKEYEYEDLNSQPKVFEYSNYRRDLTSLQIDFGDADGLLGAYKATWGDPTFSKIFNPSVMDYFSYNLMFDGVTPLVSGADIAAFARGDNTIWGLPLAADPYMALPDADDVIERVNPFYTMYCLDAAYDIKARIRMVVREWDRTFPTSSADLEFLSDIFKGANARQDNNLVEISGELDAVNGFNDMQGWDDFIPMRRTPGIFDPFTTIYEPSNGWFYDPSFPRYVK